MNLLEHSKEIMDVAIATYKPKAIALMFSGGDDSLTAYHVCRELGYKIDIVVHGNTRTGVEETTLFVRNHTEKMGDFYVEADAGDAYVKYVMRKGFFGKGIDAHSFAYHVLKVAHFRKAVSKQIRKGRRNFPILFVNGARRQESANRMKMMKSPYKSDPAQKHNVWVNIINEWTKEDCTRYLADRNIKRNPVSVQLCRSGECMCGTMQTEAEYQETKAIYPKWGQRMDELRKAVTEKFPWDWGQSINKRHHMEMNGQLNMFQPMCVGCKINYENISD